MHSKMTQIQTAQISEHEKTDLDPPRSPSRVGFMRPQLRRQFAFASLDWAESSDSSDDDDNWEFASTLLIPFQPSSSDDSDLSDDAKSDIEPQELLCKPLLPQSTSIVEAPIDISVEHEVACISVATSEEEEPYISLAVTDHGHSRSALSHLKEFWHSRFDDYARMEAQIMQNSAYGGIVEVNRSRDALRALLLTRLARVPNMRPAPAPTESTCPRVPSANLNAPIYPRTGDLSSLHDSRSATLDRAFCNYPLYSINKILFLHDMLHRSTSTHPFPHKDSAAAALEIHQPARHIPPHMDDTFVDISLSNSHSDSNDVTLVSAASSLCSLPGYYSKRCEVKHEVDIMYTIDPSRDWEIDWTARWKVLLNSTKDDSLCLRSSTFPPPVVDEAAFFAALNPERSKTPKFFFAEEEDEFAGLDDDEDYGDPIDRPMYGLSAETLSKEFLHTFDYQAGL